MLSIIICNRTSSVAPELEENIRNTVGVEYEIVSIDNSHGQFNIFQAYNEGVQRATGNILCFMHDDVQFKNNGWGVTVEHIFAEDDNLGVLGVAGGHIMPNCPCSWWSSEITSMHVFTLDTYGQPDEAIHREYAESQSIVEVASVDGLWMCIRRNLFDTIHFDDKTFSGFHCYDSDICMQILMAGYRIKVTYNIDILHKGKGNLNKQYYQDIELWYDKWQKYLPVARGLSISENELKIHQYYAAKSYKHQKELLELYGKLQSPEYRLGHFLLKPYRFIKRIIK